MRFMMIVRADRETEEGVLPSKEMFEEMGKFNDELIGAGRLHAADGLQPSSRGARVVFSRRNPTVQRGPFDDVFVAGFWVIEAGSMDDAIELAKRVPFEEGTIEIRPIMEASDFPDEILPKDLKAREQARRNMQKQNLNA